MPPGYNLEPFCRHLVQIASQTASLEGCCPPSPAFSDPVFCGAACGIVVIGRERRRYRHHCQATIACIWTDAREGQGKRHAHFQTYAGQLPQL
jgi:hypothetical protein